MADKDLGDVLRRNEARLMALPNVTGIGIGEKNGRPVIKVYITHRVPASELAADELVPPSLEGCDVDVEELGTPQIQESREE